MHLQCVIELLGVRLKLIYFFNHQPLLCPLKRFQTSSTLAAEQLCQIHSFRRETNFRQAANRLRDFGK